MIRTLRLDSSIRGLACVAVMPGSPGKPVQTCSLRRQVVVDTSTGYFTASFETTRRVK